MKPDAPVTPSQPAAGPAPRSEWEAAEFQDKADRESTNLALADWHDSGEYNANRRLISSHLDRMAPEDRERYEAGALENGTRLLNDPATLRKLASEARAHTPALLAEAAKKHAGNEKAAIDAMMADRNSAYWRGPDAELLQARYRDLIREGQSVQEFIEQRYSKADYERELAYVREHINEPGFEEKQIAKLISSGMTPRQARSAADYVKDKLRRT